MLQRWIVVPVGVATVVVTLLFVLLPSASAGRRTPAARQCFKPSTGGVRRFSVAEPAKFTSKLVKEAGHELGRSQVLQGLLKGAPYRTPQFGPWLDSAGRHVLGVVFFVRLSQPMHLWGTWPYEVARIKRGRDYYAVHQERFAYRGVNQLTVDVDAQATSVVTIIPNDGNLVNCR